MQSISQIMFKTRETIKSNKLKEMGCGVSHNNVEYPDKINIIVPRVLDPVPIKSYALQDFTDHIEAVEEVALKEETDSQNDVSEVCGKFYISVHCS